MDRRTLDRIATVMDACLGERRSGRGRGHPPAGTVRVLATLRQFLREGAPWRGLKATPEKASGSTLRRRLQDWAAESLLQQAHAVLVAMRRGHPDLILDSCSARAKRVQVSDLEALFAPLLAALFTVCDPRRAQGRRSALPPLAAARVGDRFQGGEQASERHHGGIQHRRDAGPRRPPADDPLGLESCRHAPPFSRAEQPCVPAIDGTLGQARRNPWCSRECAKKAFALPF
jgi:hypothetical protein